mmetsp:Transcript_19039/g.38480  ORF Transcript_19039/g.38480 Transcript_19039/m.38480 type:complete len:491 (-) Transcript_19039:326-1798(-)
MNDLIAAGDYKELRKFIKDNGRDLNQSIYGDGWYPLHMAVHFGLNSKQKECGLKCVKVLIELNADVNSMARDCMTPLSLAAESGRSYALEHVRVLLEAKADPNLMKDDAKGTVSAHLGNVRKNPLHWALEKKNLPIAKMLVDAKADVELQNASGRTAIQLAAESGTAQVIRLLVDAQADVTKRMPHPHTSPSGVSSSMREKEHMNALELAYYDESDTKKLKYETLKAAVEKAGTELPAAPAPLNLIYASGMGDIKGIQTALSAGVQLDATFKERRPTAFLKAIMCEQYDAARFLLEKGASVNANDGEVLLLLAQRNDLLHFKEFSKAGADISLKGDLCLMEFVRLKNFKALTYMIEEEKYDVQANYGGPILAEKLVKDDSKLVRFFVEHGADVNTLDAKLGTSVLHNFTMKKDASMVKLLLENKADVNLRVKNDHDNPTAYEKATDLAKADLFAWKDILDMLKTKHEEVPVLEFLCRSGSRSRALRWRRS